MNASLLLVALTLSAPSGFGAVASAPLERGSLALWGSAGYPEMRAGFRQGLEQVELTAEAGADWTLAKVYATGGARLSLLEGTSFKLAGELQGGLFANAGARWADPENKGGAGLRLEPGASFTWFTTWPVSWLAYARAPLEFPFGPAGVRTTLLVGGGAEVAVSKDWYVTFAGGFGPSIHFGAASPVKLGIEAGGGFGYRVF